MAQRVARRPAAPAPEPVAARPVRWRRAATGAAILLLLVAAAGALVNWTLAPATPRALAGCHLGRSIGPHQYAAAPAACIDPAKGYYADVTTTRGHFAFVMPPGTAPNTVNNFVALAVNGFYSGLRFDHVEDWVAQAGDPVGSGTGGPGYVLPDEPSSGEWVPGAVGMARYPGGAVNGSQFFVLRSAWPGSGPGGTTFNRFGTVVIGLDIVQQLTTSDRIIGISVKPS